MQRPILTSVLLVFASAALGAQQSSSSDQYQGVSAPPPDSTITAQQADEATPPPAKPPAGKPLAAQPVAPAQAQTVPVPPADQDRAGQDRAGQDANADVAQGTDDGIVQIAPESQDRTDSPESGSPELRKRAMAADPDGDIVHPQPEGPGVVASGVTIRARLLTQLSTTDSQVGETFRAKVASDVVQNGEVLIPAGAEIDGRVAAVSSGSAGGRGSLHLRPETVILAGGRRFRMDATVTGTPGSKTTVNGEGVINAGSRMKKDGIEYGGAVGAGAATGAMIGGPVGALTGSLIGAGAITVHLLVSHPQAVLEPGTVLLFTLNDRLNLVSAGDAAADVSK